MKDIKDYTILISYSKEDRCYIAKVLELPGCMAHGETAEDALKEIKIAMKGWLEVAKKSKIKIPKPLTKKTLNKLIPQNY